MALLVSFHIFLDTLGMLLLKLMSMYFFLMFKKQVKDISLHEGDGLEYVLVGTKRQRQVSNIKEAVLRVFHESWRTLEQHSAAV